MSQRDHGLEEVFVDSNCLSYVVDAMWAVSPPTDQLAGERVALLRIYLYAAATLWTVPTVKQEFERIRDAERLANHRAATSVLFGVRPLQRPDAVASRAAGLLKLHQKPADCRIVAEVEDVGGRVLLTFDGDLVRRIKGHTPLKLRTPSQFWGELAIPRGAKPRTVPAPENPLAGQTWWRW